MEIILKNQTGNILTITSDKRNTQIHSKDGIIDLEKDRFKIISISD